jgi:xanthine/uracil permease
VNDLGSIQSVNELLKPAGKERRVTRGIVLTGLANIASGFLGVIGPVNYSLSPGIMLTTRCASRYTLLPTAAILVLLSVSPAAAGFIGSVPSVVIGSVLGYVMISQIAAGLILAFQGVGENGFQLEDGMVIGAAVLAGTIVSFFPQAAVDAFPPFLRPILANGFVVGVLSALLLEFLITKNPQRCRSTRRRDK